MADYYKAIFYTEEGTLIKEQPNVSGMPIPAAPTISGKEFVKYCPAMDDMINGTRNVRVKIGDGQSVPLSFLSRKLDSQYRYIEMFSGGNDQSISLSIIYPNELETEHVFKLTCVNDEKTYTSEEELFDKRDTEITIKDSSEESKKATVSFDVLGVEGRDVSYYAMYKDAEPEKLSVRFWHYDSDGKNVTDKETSNILPGSPYAAEMQPEKPTLDSPREGKESKWICNWKPTPPTVGSEITSSLSIEGEFTSRGKLAVRMGVSENADSDMTVIWCNEYPNLTIPIREGFNFAGAYLYKTNALGQPERVIQTHDKNGLSVAVCNQKVLVEGLSSCYIQSEWGEYTRSVKDIDSLRSSIQTIPSPFASEFSATAPIIDATPFLGETSTDIVLTGRKNPNIIIGSETITASDGDFVEHFEKVYQFKDGAWNRVRGISFQTGFNSDFNKEVDSSYKTGRVITRKQLNSLGNIGTQCQFFEQCGGFYTFDEKLSDSVGGYPAGAFLQFYDEDEKVVRTVVSIKDDNTKNFIKDKTWIDGVWWKYVDDNPVVNVNIDYSSYDDVSSSIFVSTGLADLYEVKYDSFLQLFAVGFLECASLARDEIEDMIIPLEQPVEGEETPEAATNGLYWSNAVGASYLDVYPKNSNAFGSSIVGEWRPFSFGQCIPAVDIFHFECMGPLSPFSIGIQLNKGDKVRIRNSIVSTANATSSSLSGYPRGVVHSAIFDDKKLKRNYPVKFAHLYRRYASV